MFPVPIAQSSAEIKWLASAAANLNAGQDLHTVRKLVGRDTVVYSPPLCLKHLATVVTNRLLEQRRAAVSAATVSAAAGVAPVADLGGRGLPPCADPVCEPDLE
jgi:hypothetical protein